MLTLESPFQVMNIHEGTVHYCWDDDDDRTLCGFDISDGPFVADEVDCVKCLEIDELLTDFDCTGESLIIDEILDKYRK